MIITIYNNISHEINWELRENKFFAYLTLLHGRDYCLDFFIIQTNIYYYITNPYLQLLQ